MLIEDFLNIVDIPKHEAISILADYGLEESVVIDDVIAKYY